MRDSSSGVGGAFAAAVDGRGRRMAVVVRSELVRRALREWMAWSDVNDLVEVRWLVAGANASV